MNLSEPDIKRISEYMFVKTNIRPVDLCLVFGSRFSDLYAHEVKKMFDQEMFNRVLVSGGINELTGNNEADEIFKALVELGLPEKNIYLEKLSTNSLENVINSRDVIQSEIGLDQVRNIISITKDYSARRCLMTIAKHLPEIDCSYVKGVNVFDTPQEKWYEDKLYTNKVIEEYNKIPRYIEQGDILEIEIINGEVRPKLNEGEIKIK